MAGARSNKLLEGMMATEISDHAASAVTALHNAIEDNYDALKQQCKNGQQLAQLKKAAVRLR